ncbi:hypothetical protein EV175_006039 [Coemansia sp. RSA 1933]|nr:hypothetical protein EV175_006039 [Coemansia sp. RSA 1933]
MAHETQRLRYMYWRFVVLGIATLMAWNIYIVSSDFFRHELRNTPFRDSFESLFSVLSNTVNLAALAYALYTLPKADHDRRIRIGLLATLAVFCVILLLPLFAIEGWLSLLVALSALCVAAVAAAYIQCSIFGIVALLPPSCAEGYMSGQAIAGTVASAAQLIAVYSAPPDPDIDVAAAPNEPDLYQGRLRLRTAVYFCFSALFMALSTVAWVQLHPRLPLNQQLPQDNDSHTPHPGIEYRQLPTNATENDQDSRTLVSNMVEGSPRLGREPSAHQYGGGDHSHPAISEDPQRQRQQVHVLSEMPSASAHTDGDRDDCDRAAAVHGPLSANQSLPRWIVALGLENAQLVYATYREVLPYVYICAVVMGQTLAVFPPLTEAVVSSPGSKPRVAHLPSWHFLVFNLGDYFGRLSTQWLKTQPASSGQHSWLAVPRILHLVNAARWLLVAAFLLFPTNASDPLLAIGALLHSDLLFLFLVFVLGWSNGWVATTALILGPKAASDKELAGSILGFALCIGLVAGALASYPVLLIAGIS